MTDRRRGDLPDGRPHPRERELPGDELIPGAEVVMDRVAELDAPLAQVWPWLIQLGKGRAGWYLTRRLERLTPRGSRALRRIEPEFQTVAIWERVADYGREGWFEARVVEPPHTLVWWSERGRALSLTWALVLTETGPETSELHIRLRINRAIGRRLPAIVQWSAERFDAVTIRMMVAGLRERLADSAA
ncbi:MAG: hypothetical protein M3022_06415 [Actinomycetota bacterium]|nr:hypothetical protein [Actinomycetota bacterium]